MKRFIGILGVVLAFPAMAQQSDLSEYAKAADTLRETLDTTSFDYDTLSFDLSVLDLPGIAAAFDARMQTQVYAGVLRGGKGALAAGAGNALDQALALAGALRDGGYDVRIAHATLPETEARALIANSRPAAAIPATQDLAAAMAALQNMQSLIGDSDVLQPVQTLLETGLPAAGMPDVALEVAKSAAVTLPDGAVLDTRILQEAQDYYWVQARLFGLDDWQDFHIAYTPSAPLQPADFLPETLPEEMFHRIRVDFLVETREGEDFSTSNLMQQQEFTVAGLGHDPVVLSVVPDIMLRGGALADVERSAFYFPLLGDVLAPDAQAFNMQGETLAAEKVLSGGGAENLVSSVSSTAMSAGNMIGSLGGAEETPEEPDTRETTGLILRLTYLPPYDAERITFERYLVDRVGPANRAAEGWQVQDNARPLVGVWTLHISGAAMRSAEMLDLQINRIDDVAGQETPALVNPAESAALGVFFDAVGVAGAGKDALVYHGAPFIMLSETGLTPEGSRVYATDIMQTGLRAFSDQGDGWHADPAAAFRAGVAQTLLEATLMDSADSRGATKSRAGSWGVLSAAPDLVMVSDTSTLEDLDIPKPAKLAARRDLERGQILAMATGETPAWWRIDPLTGATIGVDVNGYGAEAVEYLQIVDVIITSAFGINGAVQCGTDLCCQATNVGWTILGYALIGGAGEAATALNFTDELFATSLGLSAGAGTALTGQNPLSGLCK